MPSAAHQDLLLLFRCHSDLLPELARRAGAPLGPTNVELHPADTQLDAGVDPPLVLQVDLAVVAHHRGRTSWGLALEIQLQRDPGKHWSLPLYRAALRYRLRQPAWVLVFSPCPRVREWLTRELFDREPELAPLIVAADTVPQPTDLSAASGHIGWAVLAAVVHATAPIVEAALLALLTLAPEHHQRYGRLIMSSVPEHTLREVIERLPPQLEAQLSDWERRGASFVRGRRECLEAGHAQGLEAGHAQGLEAGLRRALHDVVAARQLTVSDAGQSRIEACADLDQLQRWLTAAASQPPHTKFEP